MLNDLKPAVLAFVAVIIVAVIGATTILVVEGYGESATTIGVALAAVVPLLLGQAKIHGTVADTKAKVDTILNGGSSEVAAAAVDRVVEARVAEHDDALTQLADAVETTSPGDVAQRLAAIEAQAAKSRP